MEEYEANLKDVAGYYQDVHLSDVAFVFPGTTTKADVLGEGDREVITTDVHQIPGHRLVLSLRSPAFHRAFSQSKTSIPSKHIRLPIKIIVKDTKMSVFEALLKYIYTGEMVDIRNEAVYEKDYGVDQLGFLLDLLRTGFIYHIPSFCAICTVEIQALLCMDTVMDILVKVDDCRMAKPVGGETIHRRSLEASLDSEEKNLYTHSLKRCHDILATLQDTCSDLIQDLSEKEFEAVIENSSMSRCTTDRIICIFRRRSASPLCLAVRFQLVRVIDVLLANNESVETPDEKGKVPLQVALEMKNDTMARHILNSNHTISISSYAFTNSETTSIGLLHIAAANGSKMHTQILLNQNPNHINAFIEHRERKTGVSSSSSLSSSSSSSLSSSFISHPKQPSDFVFQNGQTALHIATRRGHSAIVRLLLEYQAIPNLQDADGNTAIHFCADTETAMALLEGERKSSLNIPNKRGQVPLHMAASRGLVNLVGLLLESGANQHVMDDQGQMPFHQAAANGHASVLLVLLRSMKEEEEITQQQLKQDQLKAQDDKMEDKKKANEEKETKSETISRREAPNVAKASDEVSSNSMPRFIDLVDAKDNTALHLAAMAPGPGCEKAIKVLLENGANPNLGNWIGHTPLLLFCAHQDGPASVVDLFLKHNATLHAQGADGNTALHLAVGRGSTDVVIALVRAGAQVHLRDAAGRTVIDLSESAFQGSMAVPLIRNIAYQPTWVPDDSVTTCCSCGTSFSVSIRKHHCRHCGRIVCFNCSSHSIALPKFDLNKPERVCQLCYDVLSFRRLM